MIEVNNPNESYFRKLIKGEISLVKTYWAWFIVFTLILKTILGFSLDLQEMLQSQINDLFTITLYLLTLIYTIFIFFAIFRSANNYEGPRFWAVLAKLSITIYLSFALFNAIYSFRLYYSKDFAVSSQINAYKKELPLIVDSFTKLVDIKKDANSIFYTYELHISANESKEYDFEKFDKEVKSSLCQEESSLDLLKNDYILNYLYIDKNQKEILNIITTKDDCGDGIYDLDIIKELLRKNGH